MSYLRDLVSISFFEEVAPIGVIGFNEEGILLDYELIDLHRLLSVLDQIRVYLGLKQELRRKIKLMIHGLKMLEIEFSFSFVIAAPLP
jgi:hypothetical protein